MVGTATFNNSGAAITQTPANWAASHGANPNRAANQFDASGGYNVTPTKGMTAAQLQAQFNQPAITPEQRNTPRLPETARQAAQVASTAATKAPVGQHTANETARTTAPSPKGQSR